MSFASVFGNRLKDLRLRRGLTQANLAEMLGVQRVSIGQIENGQRKVSIEEAIKLSEIFQIPVDILIDQSKEIEVILEEAKNTRLTSQKTRINVPQKNLAKFREVLLYILNRIGSKPNIGETVLYKILYFIDFDFYEKYEEQLIGATYIKNRFGPTPCEFKKIVDRMAEAGEILRFPIDCYGRKQTKYIALREPNLLILKAHEIKLIDEVLNRLSDLNATQISEYSHGDVPWLTTPDGLPIEYESVFYRTPMYSVRECNEDIQKDLSSSSVR